LANPAIALRCGGEGVLSCSGELLGVPVLSCSAMKPFFRKNFQTENIAFVRNLIHLGMEKELGCCCVGRLRSSAQGADEPDAAVPTIGTTIMMRTDLVASTRAA
jgi:hypothetical protein